MQPKRTLYIILLLSVFILPVSSLSAQSIASKSDVVSLADSLLDESYNAAAAVNSEKMLDLSLRALDISTDASYQYGKVRAIYLASQALFNTGFYDEALKIITQLNKTDIEEGDELDLAQIYRVKGQIYSYLKMHTQAHQAFDAGIKEAEKVEPPQHKNFLISSILESKAVDYEGREQYNLALEYYLKNLEIVDLLEGELAFTRKVNVYTLLGEYFIRFEQHDTTKYYLNNALELIDKYKYGYRSRVLTALSEVCIRSYNADSALIYLYDALDNLKLTRLTPELPVVYELFAKAYQLKGNADSVAHYERMKSDIDIQLSKSKENTTAIAIQKILDDHSRDTKSRYKLTLVLISIGILLLLSGITYVIWRMLQQRMLRRKKQELSVMKEQLSDAVEEVNAQAKNNDPTFIIRFEEVYPEFWKKLNTLHPDLSPAELKLCAMTYLGFTTSQIAKFEFVQPSSVQVRRSRMRKKIKLDSSVDLREYLNSIIDNC